MRYRSLTMKKRMDQRRALSGRYGHAKAIHTTRYRGADLVATHVAVNPTSWNVDIWVENSLGRRFMEQTTVGSTEKQAVDRAKRVVDAMKGD